MPLRDQDRVLAVEADSAARRSFAIDVLVRVDEHAVLAAEPPPQLVELLAQLGVCVDPRVARQPPVTVRTVWLVGVVAERGRDDGARLGQQRLGMARFLRPRHRELHVGEEAACTTLADVALRPGVRHGGRRPDDIEAELRAELL